MKKALPFLMLGDKAIEELERKINDTLRSLYPQWLSESDQFSFTVTKQNKLLAIDGQSWDICGSSDTNWVAFKKDEKSKNKVLKEIFELDQYTNFKSTKLTDAVYHDFINSNISVIFDAGTSGNVDTEKRLTAASNFGSGAVLGSILHGSINIPVAIGGEVVMGICAEFNQKLKNPNSQRQLSPRETSLGKLNTELEVTAGKVQISFGDFSNMGVGDIVLLDRKIGEPFNANLSNDVQSNVQLCRLGNQKAIQFIE